MKQQDAIPVEESKESTAAPPDERMEPAAAPVDEQKVDMEIDTSEQIEPVSIGDRIRAEHAKRPRPVYTEPTAHAPHDPYRRLSQPQRGDAVSSRTFDPSFTNAAVEEVDGYIDTSYPNQSFANDPSTTSQRPPKKKKKTAASIRRNYKRRHTLPKHGKV
jgi:hypothetical protein